MPRVTQLVSSRDGSGARTTWLLAPRVELLSSECQRVSLEWGLDQEGRALLTVEVRAAGYEQPVGLNKEQRPYCLRLFRNLLRPGLF